VRTGFADRSRDCGRSRNPAATGLLCSQRCALILRGQFGETLVAVGTLGALSRPTAGRGRLQVSIAAAALLLLARPLALDGGVPSGTPVAARRRLPPLSTAGTRAAAALAASAYRSPSILDRPLGSRRSTRGNVMGTPAFRNFFLLLVNLDGGGMVSIKVIVQRFCRLMAP
jgi:hypothetical protein